MYWFLIAAAAIFYAVKRHKRRAIGPTGLGVPASRSQRSGEQGEAVVQAELRAALEWLCGDNFYLHPGALLLNHAPGSAFPTAEVDHLAITPFGIFVVETKNWAGRIEPGPDVQSVVRIGADGHREIRRSPIQQNRSKVAFLRSMLPGRWLVEGIAVFPNPHCDLSSALPANLMRAIDLRQWLRDRKSRHDARNALPVNVVQARRAILAVAETGAEAIEMHRAKLRENPKKLPCLP
ncbi:nuclease [Paraburkholderia hospita]|uniref:Nuclease n=1 Tax=Paraburkholderia hospita TaxID=169430 RepID=A0AAN1MQ87_9BURK|nr:nuclease-related domain-containing protein [Paraburkholderia hospita]AUT75442.1 nuclease [Paraburkholderia hospita]